MWSCTRQTQNKNAPHRRRAKWQRQFRLTTYSVSRELNQRSISRGRKGRLLHTLSFSKLEQAIADTGGASPHDFVHPTAGRFRRTCFVDTRGWNQVNLVEAHVRGCVVKRTIHLYRTQPVAQDSGGRKSSSPGDQKKLIKADDIPCAVRAHIYRALDIFLSSCTIVERQRCVEPGCTSVNATWLIWLSTYLSIDMSMILHTRFQ
jgi:hypothetical protein